MDNEGLKYRLIEAVSGYIELWNKVGNTVYVQVTDNVSEPAYLGDIILIVEAQLDADFFAKMGLTTAPRAGSIWLVVNGSRP